VPWARHGSRFTRAFEDLAAGATSGRLGVGDSACRFGPVPTAAADPAPERVLAVYAHPDDPEVSCAGTLSRWVRAGSEVHLVIATRGEKGSSDPGADPEALAAQRRGEADAAATVMGLTSHELLGYPDGEMVNSVELRGQLVERIRRIRPDVVVGPDPTAVFFGSSYVNHHDHREIGFALLDACAPAASSPLYFPDAGPAHHVGAIYLSGTLEPDTWVEITDTIDVKAEALLCHRSQVGAETDLAAEIVRRRAASAGSQAGVAYAEAYRVLRFT
jgi:LmbE family N-acetylglucosaminyl deacetylase